MSLIVSKYCSSHYTSIILLEIGSSATLGFLGLGPILAETIVISRVCQQAQLHPVARLDNRVLGGLFCFSTQPSDNDSGQDINWHFSFLVIYFLTFYMHQLRHANQKLCTLTLNPPELALSILTSLCRAEPKNMRAPNTLDTITETPGTQVHLCMFTITETPGTQVHLCMFTITETPSTQVHLCTFTITETPGTQAHLCTFTITETPGTQAHLCTFTITETPGTQAHLCTFTITETPGTQAHLCTFTITETPGTQAHLCTVTITETPVPFVCSQSLRHLVHRHIFVRSQSLRHLEHRHTFVRTQSLRHLVHRTPLYVHNH